MQEGCRFLLVLKLRETRSSCGVEIEENMEGFPLVVEIKGEEGRRGSCPPCGVEIEGNTGREVASSYSIRVMWRGLRGTSLLTTVSVAEFII